MQRAWLVVVVVVAACSVVFPPKRTGPPGRWSLEAAVLHSMVTAPPAFGGATPDCSAAPMPDLQLFCENKCDLIGELSLKAYCAWSCDEVKNPDLRVFCKLEIQQRDKPVRAEHCDAIDDAGLQAHCKHWVASLPTKPKPKH